LHLRLHQKVFLSSFMDPWEMRDSSHTLPFFIPASVSAPHCSLLEESGVQFIFLFYLCFKIFLFIWSCPPLTSIPIACTHLLLIKFPRLLFYALPFMSLFGIWLVRQLTRRFSIQIFLCPPCLRLPDVGVWFINDSISRCGWCQSATLYERQGFFDFGPLHPGTFFHIFLLIDSTCHVRAKTWGKGFQAFGAGLLGFTCHIFLSSCFRRARDCSTRSIIQGPVLVAGGGQPGRLESLHKRFSMRRTECSQLVAHWQPEL
jgi:hypothetical protein